MQIFIIYLSNQLRVDIHDLQRGIFASASGPGLETFISILSVLFNITHQDSLQILHFPQ